MHSLRPHLGTLFVIKRVIELRASIRFPDDDPDAIEIDTMARKAAEYLRKKGFGPVIWDTWTEGQDGRRG